MPKCICICMYRSVYLFIHNINNNILVQRQWYSMRPILGILSIYFLYCLAAILQQTILTTPYLSASNYEYNYFQYPVGFVLFPAFISWAIGLVFNINNNNLVSIPNTHTFRCGLLIFVSSMAFSSALYYGSYPVSVLLRSYNIVPLAIVGLFLGRATHTDGVVGVIADKIKSSKIVFGAITTISIATFLFARSERSLEKQNTPFNLTLIIISLLADGFINAFQNQIKLNSQPKGLELYEQINKWKLILCLSYLLITFQATDFFKYFYYNQKCLWHFVFYGILSSMGELVIYWLLTIFRNNVVPFIVSTRKITTVLLSVIFFTHHLSIVQMGAVLLMYVTMVCNFFKEVTAQNMQEKEAVRTVINNVIQGQSFVKDHQDY